MKKEFLLSLSTLCNKRKLLPLPKLSFQAWITKPVLKLTENINNSPNEHGIVCDINIKWVLS